MAKPKLSAGEKAALRRQFKKSLAAGEKRSDVIRELAEKFKVTTETVRWHGKKAAGVNGRAAKKGRPSATRSPRAVRQAKRGRNGTGANGSVMIGKLARQFTPDALERALLASKLVAELRGHQARSKDLRQELRKSDVVAGRLERKIDRLVRS